MNRDIAKKSLFTAVGLIVMTALLYQGLKRVDLQQVAIEMRAINPLAQLTVVLLFFFSRYFQAARFRALHPAGKGGFFHCGVSLAAQFINAVVPMRGGEVIRPYYLLRLGTDTQLKAVVVATVIDKFIEGLALIPLVATCYFFFRSEITDLFMRMAAGWNFKIIAAMILVGIGLVASCIYLMRRNQKSLGDFLRAEGFLKSLGYGTLHWGFFILGFAMLIGDLKVALFVGVVVNVASAVPVSPGSVGVFEGSFIWAMSLFRPDQPTEKSLAVAVVLHFLFLIIPLIGGVWFFVRYGRPQKLTVQDLSTDTEKI